MDGSPPPSLGPTFTMPSLGFDVPFALAARLGTAMASASTDTKETIFTSGLRVTVPLLLPDRGKQVEQRIRRPAEVPALPNRETTDSVENRVVSFDRFGNRPPEEPYGFGGRSPTVLSGNPAIASRLSFEVGGRDAPVLRHRRDPGPEELLEHRPVVLHGRAEVLGGGPTVVRSHPDLVRRPVVGDDIRMVHGDVGGPPVEVLHRIAAGPHELGYEDVTLAHRFGRMVDEAGLDRPPLLLETGLLVRRE